MTVKNPSDFFDSDALKARVAQKAGNVQDDSAYYPLLLEELKPAYEAGRAAIRQRFESEGKALQTLKHYSQLTDKVLRVQAECWQARLGLANKQVLCIATGGYGRQELFPYSDIDLLFIHTGTQKAKIEQFVQQILYGCWDLGLKVGHALRTSDEAMPMARDDATICSAMLDMRRLWGSQSLYKQFTERFREEVQGAEPQQFMEAKLEERRKRIAKAGDSRFLLEPNVKSGKGALRDIHTLEWLAKYMYGVARVSQLVERGVLTKDELRDYTRARQFLVTVRMHLHMLAGRPEERLTFDMQKRIGEQLGYRTHHEHRPVERFMKRYFQVAKVVGNLTRLFCAVLEEEKKRKPLYQLGRLWQRTRRLEGFIVDNERLNVEDEQQFDTQPIDMLRLFHTAPAYELDLHPKALQLVARHLPRIDHEVRHAPEANRLFMEMLLSDKGPEVTLRRMNEAGVLAQFLPEFGQIVGQMQYDMYHIYTVDEHVIVALGILHAVEQGKVSDELPLSTRVIQQIQSRRALYVGLLCHDIAKGQGGDHAHRGVQIVRKLGARFGLNESETELAAWLVEAHLVFSDTAFKRDLDDKKTIEDFIAEVQSLERLRLLLLITVADIRAVGPNIWNRWKGSLLRELYTRAEMVMTGGAYLHDHAQVEIIKESLARQLEDWGEEECAEYLAEEDTSFWLHRSVEEHVQLADMVRRLRRGEENMGVDYSIDAENGVTYVTVCLTEQPDALVHVAGVMQRIGASIVGAKLFVLKGNLHVVSLMVQHLKGQPFRDEERLGQMQELLASSLNDPVQVEPALQAPTHYSPRLDAFDVPVRVLIDNEVSATHTVLEVNARDRLGLLYDITRSLHRLGLNVTAAHIQTYGEKAVDVFYVKDAFGFKVVHWTKLDAIRSALHAAAQPHEEENRQTGS